MWIRTVVAIVGTTSLLCACDEESRGVHGGAAVVPMGHHGVTKAPKPDTLATRAKGLMEQVASKSHDARIALDVALNQNASAAIEDAMAKFEAAPNRLDCHLAVCTAIVARIEEIKRPLQVVVEGRLGDDIFRAGEALKNLSTEMHNTSQALTSKVAASSQGLQAEYGRLADSAERISASYRRMGESYAAINTVELVATATETLQFLNDAETMILTIRDDLSQVVAYAAAIEEVRSIKGRLDELQAHIRRFSEGLERVEQVPRAPENSAMSTTPEPTGSPSGPQPKSRS